MAVAELDSFIVKLKLLMNAGYEASLNVVCKDRKMCIDLKAEIALDDDAQDFGLRNKWQPIRSPSYRRRQERRRAARVKAEEANGSMEATVNNDISHQASCNEVTEKVATKARSSSVVSQAADEGFQCQSCEFRSKWDTGFKVHMQCLHGNKAQADITEKYESTANYWKSGFLGTVYQRFLDVNDVIDGMDLYCAGKS